MSYIKIEDLPLYIKAGSTIAGIDLGTKTIGIAISDRSFQFANPRYTLKIKKFAAVAQELIALFEKEQVCAIVIGLPLNMDGTSGPRAQATRAFVRNMEKFTSLPFIFQDERLSSVAAERNLLEYDFSRRKRSNIIDSEAASIILQAALDRLKNITNS